MELAPGSNHHPPKPCEGVSHAGQCMSPGSDVFGKETSSHEVREMWSVGDPSCQRRS